MTYALVFIVGALYGVGAWVTWMYGQENVFGFRKPDWNDWVVILFWFVMIPLLFLIAYAMVKRAEQ